MVGRSETSEKVKLPRRERKKNPTSRKTHRVSVKILRKSLIYLRCPNFSKLCNKLEIEPNTAIHYFTYHGWAVKDMRKSKATSEG